MKKNSISSNYSTSGVFCQALQRYKAVGIVFFMLISLFVSLVASKIAAAAEYTEKKGTAIVDNCNAIKEDLKSVQKNDSKARLYLGGRYETLLNKYVKALNVKLVKNNDSNINLLENQNQLVQAKSQFVDDFIAYQKELEDLIAMDCKNSPKNFYEKLETVRSVRAKVRADVANTNAFLGQHIHIVGEMVGGGNDKAE